MICYYPGKGPGKISRKLARQTLIKTQLGTRRSTVMRLGTVMLLVDYTQAAATLKRLDSLAHFTRLSNKGISKNDMTARHSGD